MDALEKCSRGTGSSGISRDQQRARRLPDDKFSHTGHRDSPRNLVDMDGTQVAPSVSSRAGDLVNWRMTIAFFGVVVLLTLLTAAFEPGAGFPGVIGQ